jgi:hypothetical protein
MSRKLTIIALLGCVAQPTDAALAGGGNVGVIDNGGNYGPAWCQFLTDHGYTCTLFPEEGPTGPLDPFRVVIDLSGVWADPTGMLADFMRAGKTVITMDAAPGALGVNSNPTVQGWIGANAPGSGSDRLLTTVRDPILGNIPPGTELGDCADSLCGAVTDTTGHPRAKVLAVYHLPVVPERIAILRNDWQGGISVYLGVVGPGAPLGDQIALNAVQARQLIPTVGMWGVLVLALGIAAAGTIVLRRRSCPTGSRAALVALLAASFALYPATGRSQFLTGHL